MTFLASLQCPPDARQRDHGVQGGMAYSKTRTEREAKGCNCLLSQPEGSARTLGRGSKHMSSLQ